MGNKGAIDDRAISRLATRQHGVVTTRQLQSAGLGRAGISRRAKAGRLHRLHKGVYAVGHRPQSIESRWMAAILACGRKDMADATGRGDAEGGRDEAGMKTVLDFWGAALSHRAPPSIGGCFPPATSRSTSRFPATGGGGRDAGFGCIDPPRSHLLP
jgi:hypothetical protein